MAAILAYLTGSAMRTTTLAMLICSSLGLGLVTATPARALDLDAAVDGTVDDDVRRFCSNIADAARDRRHVLQMGELETLRADIDERIAALEAKRAEYEEWLTRRETFLEQAQDNLVEIYTRMRPDAAAERLAATNMELAAGILMKVNARQAGTILNEMDSTIAARLTSIMASAARQKDPT